MIPAPDIMIWLVKSLIADIFEMNILQIFVKLYDSNGSLQ